MPSSPSTKAKLSASRGGVHGFDIKTYVVRADSVEKFVEAKRVIDGMAGVSIKAEAPTRWALSVEAPKTIRLASTLRKKGLHVRDEVVYQPE